MATPDPPNPRHHPTGDPSATDPAAEALLAVGVALGRFVHNATVDPDTTFRTETPALADQLASLADLLERTAALPPERFAPAPEVRPAVATLLEESRFLSYEIRALRTTLERLAGVVPRLQAESVPFQKELASLEGIARRLIGIQAVTAERGEAIRQAMSGHATFDAKFAERRILFVASEMKGTGEECMRFRAQVAFALVKQVARGKSL